MDGNSVEAIHPQDLARVHSDNHFTLIDVRTPVEFSAFRATVAVNYPLDSLNSHQIAKAAGSDQGKTLYVICKSGKRGEMAARKFIEAGYKNVKNIAGGTEAWSAAGLPVHRSTSRFTLSLEQQTRVAIGSLVVLTSLLVLVHPYFFVLPMMMGLGLLFAGVTDSCMMAMLISRMPWNQTVGPRKTCTIKPTHQVCE